MDEAIPPPPPEIEPELVEETVRLAVSGHPREAEFHARREPLYEEPDARAREAGFAALCAEWFESLGLALPIQGALAEQPRVGAGVRAVLVRSARGKQDEGADLYASREGTGMRPSAVLRLRPTTLVDAPSLWVLLRRELMHLFDMLDPAFGYDPEPPRSDVGPAYDALLVSRYRALWETTVTGRMLRRGWVGAGARAQSLARFTAAYPMLGEWTEALFGAWFDGERLRHGDLLKFAQHPGGGSEGSRCPLCRFPTARLRRRQAEARSGALAQVQRRHPGWRPEAGICDQCADLYDLRMERETMTSLPDTFAGGETVRQRGHA